MAVISKFALTYKAYDRANGFDGVAEAANQASDAWHACGILPDGLEMRELSSNETTQCGDR